MRDQLSARRCKRIDNRSPQIRRRHHPDLGLTTGRPAYIPLRGPHAALSLKLSKIDCPISVCAGLPRGRREALLRDRQEFVQASRSSSLIQMKLLIETTHDGYRDGNRGTRWQTLADIGDSPRTVAERNYGLENHLGASLWGFESLSLRIRFGSDGCRDMGPCVADLRFAGTSR